MVTLGKEWWTPPERAVITRSIGPDAVLATRSSGATLGMLYVYACLADATQERWRDEPATFLMLPRYGPHHEAVSAAFVERTLDEAALARLAPDLAQGVDLLASVHGIGMIRAVARVGYAALRLCAQLEPHVPVGNTH